MRRTKMAAFSALTLSVLTLAACAQPQAVTFPPAHAPVPAAPVGAERGSIVSSIEIGHTDLAVRVLGATATRVVYRSTSRTGDTGTEVSGVVFVPKGAPPAGGWPIVSVGHGTTGVTDECAPSLYPNLLGTIGTVAPFLERGMVVTMTDYEGLGTPGKHPYLDPDAAAHNIIDAVRAARNVVPDTGTRWGAVGNSQGGQAVWAAAERTDYGDGLELVGSAALSPVLDLAPMFDLDASNTLARMLLVPFLVDGLRSQQPDVSDSDYISGALVTDQRALTACTDLLGFQKAEAATRLMPSDAKPATEAARITMVDWLRSVALPRTPTGAPLLVVVGEQDQLIDPKWTQDAVTQACSMGDVVELRRSPDQGHSDQGATNDAVEWLSGRLAGQLASDTCQGG
ncbi:lipase family protein [Rhodococcus sp. 1168]|uniref:lipase family protein n=1 Tax=Rhodococcus sp. 1168 TaxID=2018041 RepID=UPI000A0CDE56|nr:lipase family protein [Rhodococcus sp. 1168]ORI26102.1 lipase [Rhodococcus sp. 1168]